METNLRMPNRARLPQLSHIFQTSNCESQSPGVEPPSQGIGHLRILLRFELHREKNPYLGMVRDLARYSKLLIQEQICLFSGLNGWDHLKA